MSAKATGLVWDLECPKSYGEILFRPSHKYVLSAYADHADHNGKSIFPAVHTISKKTGLDDRTVQRLTNDLETIGLLVEDGKGPRGTNKWCLPYSERGDTLTPRHHDGGDKNAESLGDIPSGDIPSGDSLPPELKEPEPNTDIDPEKEIIFEALKIPADQIFWKDRRRWVALENELKSATATIQDGVLIFSGLKMRAAFLEDRFAKSFNNYLVVNKIGGFTSLTFQE